MKQQQGIVRIDAEYKKERVIVRVRDNGNGIPKEVSEGLKSHQKVSEGIGLWNVNERLHSIYPESEGVQIDTGAWGSEVSMEIPVA